MGATFAQGLLADFITAGTLDASLIEVTNLDAGSITTGTLNAENIDVTNINGANIKNGTIGSNPLAASAVTATKIKDGSVVTAKLGGNSVISEKIATDAVINRHIQSGEIYPTTCNSTINGYFADVIEFNKLRAGEIVVDYLSAGVVSWDRFKLANGGTSYVMYRDANTGALYAHT